MRRSASRSLPVRSSGQLGELGVEQGQQRAERLFLAAVGRGGDQDQVAVRVGGQPLQELVPLVPAGPARAGVGAGVGLVDDDQLGAAAQEVAPAPVGLDQVGRDDDVADRRSKSDWPTAQSRSSRVTVLGSTSSASMWNFSRSSACHCSARWGGQSTARRRTSPRSSSSRAIRHASTVLPMPDVVGDQEPDRVELQRHQERHELVRAGLDGELGERAERPGAGAEAQADRVAEQPAGVEVADPGRVGQVERGRLDRLQRAGRSR